MIELKRDELALAHIDSPEEGDYWHEMFSPVLVVLKIEKEVVTYCDVIKDKGDSGWTWNLDYISKTPLILFKKRLCYDVGAFAEKLDCRKTWCDVLPHNHHWAAEEFERMSKENGSHHWRK